MTIDLEGAALELEQNATRTARQGILGRLDLDSWRSSTKIEALVEELSNLRLQDSSTKSLVFSQFVNFLDLIAFRLQKAGFKVSGVFDFNIKRKTIADCCIDLSPGGDDEPTSSRCNHPALQYVVIDYKVTPYSRLVPVNNVDVNVFLVSLKAGGVALNLTEASRVYLMDSWWNPAVSVL